MVSDSETYCCGFGARASCISRGLDYSGPSTPCELRLIKDSDGTEVCEGLENESGNLDPDIDCNCEGVSRPANSRTAHEKTWKIKLVIVSFVAPRSKHNLTVKRTSLSQVFG